MKGDFHKIITVGSPHLGTPLADYLIANKCNARVFVSPFNGVVFKRLEDVFKLSGRPLGPAIYSFQTSGTALKNLGSPNVPSHAIYGVEPFLSSTEGELDTLIKVFTNPLNNVDNILGGEGAHDTIVPVISERGGLPPSATRLIPGVVHADMSLWSFLPVPPPFNDVGETESLDIQAEVERVLNARIGSLDFAPFPAFSPSTTPIPLSDCSPLQPINMIQAFQSLAPAATITVTPPSGTVVQPGASIPINFTVTGGNAVNGAMFILGDRFYHIDGTGPFSFTYEVPSDKAGKLNITALTYGPGPDNYTASTQLIVAPGSAPTSIAASPSDLLLDQVGERFQIVVTGRYANGSQLDLTSSDAGTSYATQRGAIRWFQLALKVY